MKQAIQLALTVYGIAAVVSLSVAALIMFLSRLLRRLTR